MGILESLDLLESLLMVMIQFRILHAHKSWNIYILMKSAESMGYMSVFLTIAGCWNVFWRLQRFVFDSFFFLPHSLILFVCRSCKGIKNKRKKTKIPLDSNFIFEIYDHSVMWNVF